MKINWTNKNKPLLLGLSTATQWIEKIAQELSLSFHYLPKKIFADQEILVEIPVSVRNQNVFLCQSISRPANDTLMELLIAIDALNRASAKSITLIIPYFGYARQDRKAQGREPITAKLIANMLTFLKVARIVTFDLHSSQIQGFFDIPVDHLSVLPQLILRLLTKNQIKNYVLVAPDSGGYQRVKKISEYLQSDVAVMNKKRPNKNQTQVNFILGNVFNKNLIFVDDMIDTSDTLINSLEYLQKKGAKKMYVVATHAVFSNGALDKLNTLYQKGWLKKVIVSNSILIKEQKKYSFLEIYSLSHDISNIVKAIIEGGSISEYGKKQFKMLENYKTNE